MERTALAVRVAEKITEELKTGRWIGYLPGERQLASLFQVSRPTLRAALAELEKKGLLRTAQGLRREIVGGMHRVADTRSSGSATVVMLSPRPVESIDPFVILQLESLRELLARRGLTLSIEVRPSCYGQDAAGALRRLLAEIKAGVWLLWSSTRVMQGWFSGQMLPHIVLGSVFDEAGSLSVDLDNHATARHAAHVLRRFGHHRISLLMPRQGLAGDNMTEEGFRGGATDLAEGSLPAAQVEVVRHDGSPNGIRAGIDHLLALKPRPTGVFSCRGLHTIALLTYLYSRGLRIPQDVSIISRDDDQALDFVTPVLARYHRSPAKMAKAIFRLIMGILEGRKIKGRNVRILPEFQSHASLGTAP